MHTHDLHPEHRFLVLGSAGMLGTAWRRLLEGLGAAFAHHDVDTLDILDPGAVARVLDGSRPTHVVNCAAWTDVDGAETQEDLATRLNGDAVAGLVDACNRRGVSLVHYSTDYVFNGRAGSPYRVDAARDPVNAYGRSKAVGEAAIEAAGGPHLLVRTSWLYAPWGKNFVGTIAALAAEREELRVVDDQRGRPTSCVELAANTLGLINAGAAGTFHLCDSGECTWHGFASEIVRLTGSACRVVACGSDEYPRPAARPAYSVLDLAPAEAVIGEIKCWTEALSECLGERAEKT